MFDCLQPKLSKLGHYFFFIILMSSNREASDEKVIRLQSKHQIFTGHGDKMFQQDFH